MSPPTAPGAPRFSNAQLDAHAQTHVQYEVATLVIQACSFHRKYPSGMPPQGGFRDPGVDDALLEATLVHLRLLDDFLRSGGWQTDLHAKDWVPQSVWQPTCWLPSADRDAINWQVAHLTPQRAPWVNWDVRGLGYACCQELESFVEAVRAHRPACVAAFGVVETCIAQGLACLAP